MSATPTPTTGPPRITIHIRHSLAVRWLLSIASRATVAQDAVP